MARKQKTVTITEDGRDKGKVFILTELSAYEAEEWAGRALFALMNAGVQIPDNIAEAGLAGVATLGMAALTKLPYDSAKPLLDKMMACVEIQPSANVTRRLIADDIEEVATLLTLRKHVLGLHMDFSMAAAPSTSGSKPGQAARG
ncbi:hypothetical protein ACLQ9R_01465 [Bordetella hinzii]|uniref:hypothetical protein n=1 Tax=Bordetella hinzii TaxID=103855 RepID=UPI00045A4FFC|nr:hypothetical protein [Bordetella hinzii]KCB33735.1 hypothetical protein L541_4874 [Bordetella hinzii CA90 BAL1384]